MGNSESVTPTILKMQKLYNSFSDAEKRVLDCVMTNPAEVIYASVAELAIRSRVSEPTVVRACKKLGLSGYQALKITLAKELVNPLQESNEQIGPDDNARTIATKVFRSTINTMNLTYDILDFNRLEEAVAALKKAKKVTIVGLGNSQANARDLQHKLMRLGIEAVAYVDMHLATIAVSYMTEGDVLFCISHSGSSKEIVELAGFARESGIFVISLTNIGISPLSKVSNVSLHTASEETKYRILGMNSRIAQLAIIDSLYAMLSLRSNHENLMRAEKALESKKY